MIRIEHKAWWCPEINRWVPFQTYRWAYHGCWTVPRTPWIIIELQP